MTDNIAEMLITPVDPEMLAKAEQYLDNYRTAFPKLTAWIAGTNWPEDSEEKDTP